MSRSSESRNENEGVSVSTNGSTITTSPPFTAQDESNEATVGLSKRQLKKRRKLQQWAESRHLVKEKRHQKKKEFRERKKQRLSDLKSTAEANGVDPATVIDKLSRKRLKSNSMKNSSCKVGICVDMSFADLMIEKDLHKCIKQVSRCYSINRRYENPMQFYITSLTGKSEQVMNKNDGWRNWDIHFHESSYLELELYPKDKIVYLTAESDNVLREINDSTLYVIGGLVDHNSKKGLCHKLAIEKGIRHARLPLGEYVQMSVRKVLSIVHVFQIIGGAAQKRPWEEVLMEVLPQRSQATLKGHHGFEDDDNGSDTDREVPSNKNSTPEAEKTVEDVDDNRTISEKTLSGVSDVLPSFSV